MKENGNLSRVRLAAINMKLGIQLVWLTLGGEEQSILAVRCWDLPWNQANVPGAIRPLVRMVSHILKVGVNDQNSSIRKHFMTGIECTLAEIYIWFN
jgi:hypothetical protein